MTQDGGYDLTPDEKPMFPPTGNNPSSGGLTEGDAGAGGGAGNVGLKPGDPGWIPPTVIVEVEKSSEDSGDSGDEAVVDPDVEKFKGLAVLAYIFFLIPLIAAPNSKFARFHANQGLLLFILLITIMVGVTAFEVGLWLVGRFMSIYVLALFFDCGFHLLQIAMLVGWVGLMIYGIIHAANGEKRELPVIGHWTLIK